MEGQLEAQAQQHSLFTFEQNHLLQRHPVTLPVILLISSAALCAASFSANTLFPLLTLIGVPSALVCLSISIVLGVAGILASIIAILEAIDRYRSRNRLQTASFAKPKGA